MLLTNERHIDLKILPTLMESGGLARAAPKTKEARGKKAKTPSCILIEAAAAMD
jgi:hypothetical protein